MTARYWFGFSALAAAAIWFGRGLLSAPPISDSWMAVWAAGELDWWRVLTEPLTAGYVYILIFEPFFILAHAFGNALFPTVGNFAYHIIALAALLLGAAQLARLLWLATGSQPIALAAAALFLASPPSWLAVGDSSSYHYSVATWLALCSIEPAWRAYATEYSPSKVAALLSALAYALALGCKPSVAAIPLLIFLLLVAAGWRMTAAVGFVLPHAIVLAAILAWQIYILGGLGGYPFTQVIVPTNLIAAPLAVSTVVWGHAWVGFVLAVVALVLRPATIWLWFVTAVASLGPFILASPIAFQIYDVTKLLLPLALFLLLLGWSGAGVGGAVVSVVAAALLFLQWPQHSQVHAYVDEFVSKETDYQSSREPLVVLSPDLWVAYAYGHQMRPEPKGSLLAFFSPVDVQLYRALEGGFPPNARVIGVPDLPPVQLAPFSLTGIQLGSDQRGHFHLDVAPGFADGLWLTWFYQNGKTRFLFSLPVNRTHVTFPLNYSIRSVFLLRVAGDGPWQVHRWDSPWFRDPYPPIRAHGDAPH